MLVSEANSDSALNCCNHQCHDGGGGGGERERERKSESGCGVAARHMQSTTLNHPCLLGWVLGGNFPLKQRCVG
jgi:hypothetical protein